MTVSFWRYWGPLLLYLGLIFWSSSGPAPDIVSDQPDYLMHGAGYFLLEILAARAFAGGLDRLNGRSLLLGLALTTLYGLSDEWHQAFVPSRYASWADVLADATGAVLAALVLAIWMRWHRNLVGGSVAGTE